MLLELLNVTSKRFGDFKTLQWVEIHNFLGIFFECIAWNKLWLFWQSHFSFRHNNWIFLEAPSILTHGDCHLWKDKWVIASRFVNDMSCLYRIVNYLPLLLICQYYKFVEMGNAVIRYHGVALWIYCKLSYSCVWRRKYFQLFI